MRRHANPKAEDVRRAVRRLIRDADIEIIPLKSAVASYDAVPPGATITITCSPKFGLQRTLEHSALAAAQGYRVIPHVAARQVKDEAELRGFVDQLQEVGIKDLYVIGGDANEPAGIYRNAGDLLESLGTMPHTITSIGVACYPEGHPKISDEVLLGALLANQAHAHYMVSQLCFDPDAMVTWLREVREQGVTLPLHVGLASPLKTRKLVELSLRIGVGSSLHYLTKQHGMIGNLLMGTAYHPEEFLLALDDVLLPDGLGVESVHLNSFNQIGLTIEWQRRMGAALPDPHRLGDIEL